MQQKIIYKKPTIEQYKNEYHQQLDIIIKNINRIDNTIKFGDVYINQFLKKKQKFTYEKYRECIIEIFGKPSQYEEYEIVYRYLVISNSISAINKENINKVTQL